MWIMMKQLRERIIRMLKAGSITDKREQKLEYLLKTKKWNPYCISHSAITADSDYLSGYGLNKKSKVVNEFETASKVYQTKNGK
jgi:integrase/recombinase XerD